MVKVKKPKISTDGGKRNKRSKVVKGKAVGTAKLTGVKKKKDKKTMISKQAIIKTTALSNGSKPTKAQLRRIRKKMLKKSLEDKGQPKQSQAKQGEGHQKKKDSDGKPPAKKQKTNEKNSVGTSLKAFMMNLPKSANAEGVKTALGKVGVNDVEGLNIISGGKKTYGIVTFKTSEALSEAINLSKKLKIDGRAVIIRPYNSKKGGDDKKAQLKSEEDGVDSDKEESEGESDKDEEEEEEVKQPARKKGKNSGEVQKEATIRNLDQGVTAEQLKAAFEKKGLTVTSCKVTDKGPLTSGSVGFKTESDFKKAVSFDKKITLNGKAIRVIAAAKSSTEVSSEKSPPEKKTMVTRGTPSPEAKPKVTAQKKSPRGAQSKSPVKSSPRKASPLKGTKSGGVAKPNKQVIGAQQKKALKKKVKKKVLGKAS